ncbi:hypothetical protein GO730_16535 [Spirosoma sp. HMF3257]|uniref:hypothetical protein n=1 Tax=Spirosoma telluris TaxID=2183553 RepID=UPI0011B947E7|nr:hypothetical protein [Spirosoma telluris]
MPAFTCSISALSVRELNRIGTGFNGFWTGNRAKLGRLQKKKKIFFDGVDGASWSQRGLALRHQHKKHADVHLRENGNYQFI